MSVLSRNRIWEINWTPFNSRIFFFYLPFWSDQYLQYWSDQKQEHTKINNSRTLFQFLRLESPKPLSYVCLSVCPSVTSAVSGVRGSDEQQKTKFGPTYCVTYVFNWKHSILTWIEIDGLSEYSWKKREEKENDAVQNWIFFNKLFDGKKI